MNSIDLNVKGMSCQSCVKHVENAIKSITGVTMVVVDLTGGRAHIEGELEEDAQPFIKALELEGYEAFEYRDT